MPRDTERKTNVEIAAELSSAGDVAYRAILYTAILNELEGRDQEIAVLRKENEVSMSSYQLFLRLVAVGLIASVPVFAVIACLPSHASTPAIVTEQLGDGPPLKPEAPAQVVQPDGAIKVRKERYAVRHPIQAKVARGTRRFIRDWLLPVTGVAANVVTACKR